MFQDRSDLQYVAPELPPGMKNPSPTLKKLLKLPDQKLPFDIGLGNSFNASNFPATSFVNSNLTPTPREGQTLDKLELAENQLASLFGGIRSKSPVRLKMSLTPVLRANKNKKIAFDMNENQKENLRNTLYTNKFAANLDESRTPNSMNMYQPAELISARRRSLFQNPPLANSKYHELERMKTAAMGRRARNGATPEAQRPATRQKLEDSIEQNFVSD